jgi:hypothetical protein
MNPPLLRPIEKISDEEIEKAIKWAEDHPDETLPILCKWQANLYRQYLRLRQAARQDTSGCGNPFYATRKVKTTNPQ